MRKLFKWISGWFVTPEVVKPPVKPPKPKKVKIKKCIQTDKYMFTREQAEVNKNKLSTKISPLRIYCCEFCFTWHLTHHKFVKRR